MVAACVAGALLGLFYTVSPLTIWFGVAMVALFAWAGRGLQGRERTWVLGLLASALALRLLVLGAFFLATWIGDNPAAVLIPDEAYMAFRARLLRLMALGVSLSAQDYAQSFENYGDSGMHYVHAYLQLQFGEAPYALRLLHVALYLTGCVTLYRTVRPAFGALAGIGGLAIVLFLPSLFIWSISYLKETPSLFLTAVGVSAAVVAARTRSIPGRLLACVIVAIVVVATRLVRPQAEIILGGGLAAGFLGAVLIRRPALLAGALVCCLMGGVVAGGSPQLWQRASSMVVEAATNHIGFVNTPGRNYKVLDPEFYARREEGTVRPIEASRFTPAVTARYLIRGVATFFFVPLPWHTLSSSMLVYVPEQLVWILLVGLAVVGFVAGLRVDATVTVVLSAVILFAAASIGMSSGNVGTLIRHRALVAVLLPWLSSLGACELLTWLARSRNTPQELGEARRRKLGAHAAY